MNFLQLCNKTMVECGVSAQPLTTTLNQTGELGRIVGWVNDAWLDIQSEHQDWDWLRKSMSFATVAGQGIYTLADMSLTDFGMWDKDTFRNYVTSVGVLSEVFMDTIGYDTWRNSYYYGALRSTQSRPGQVAISPAKGLCLGPVPAVGYTITGDYFAAPSYMALDADIPALPTHFQMAIVFRAMMFYGGFESATEVYDRGEIEYKKVMAKLAADRLPSLSLAGALA